ncbi:MAG: DUF3990 domain-containing protein [Candidatus Methanomethylophilaceae archaeon]|nr:DUF3990 domain-containing protein [Candidatus Methanomethylophilaceae archaeon]
MKHLVKAIPSAMDMNQEQFASVLGTTPLSISRWENGKTLPNRMAQYQLYELCKNHNIYLYKNILTNKMHVSDKEKIILYHGSKKKGLIGNIAPISREKCDFGRGFYMETNPLQPLTLICNEDRPVFYTLELDSTNLNILTVDTSIEWAMLIAYHRGYMDSVKGTPIYEKYAHLLNGYDVVVGDIADDRMYVELTRFFEGTLTDAALINCLSALDPGKQFVAMTEKACENIHVLKEEILSQLELSMLKDMSIERRRTGLDKTREIELRYRREGRYFDEIIGGDSTHG